MDLRDAREDILAEIFEQMFFLTANYPMADTGDVFERLSGLFQGLGICYLLTELESEKFRENLIKSGHARRYFLRKSREQRNDADPHLGLSRCEAILDSIVAGDFALASDIASLSLEVWNKDWEYEDDFCFFLFIHTIARQAGSPRVILPAAVVAQFERALAGESSGRLEVCKALVTGDREGFVTGLAKLLAEEQERNDAERTAVMETGFLFWPRSFISIEGLALLRIAEMCGMEADQDFPLCPREARLGALAHGYPDSFDELERALGATD